MAEPTPRVVLVYGLLGLIPFLAPPLAMLAWPKMALAAAAAQAAYGALILSFLGGVRWGFAVRAPPPNPVTISLSMLPSIAGFGILTLLIAAPRAQLLALAGALVLQWVWDRRCAQAPGWFARLRTLLTAGAVSVLAAGALLLG